MSKNQTTQEQKEPDDITSLDDVKVESKAPFSDSPIDKENEEVLENEISTDNAVLSDTVSRPKNLKQLFEKKSVQLAASIGLIAFLGLGGTLHYLSNNAKSTEQQAKPSSSGSLEVKRDVIYKSVLDSSNFNEEQLFAFTYPFGKSAIQNTKQYSRSLFEKVDSIIVDPAGQTLPATSGLLPSFININFGYASINLDLNSLPKQPLFIRLVTEKDGSPYAVRHYYLTSEESRLITLDGLSGGKYYIQILNLITQTPYVSTTFNLTSNGLITGDALIKFIKIKEIDHIFRAPLEDEDSLLLVEDLPIILNADINREVLDFSKSKAIKEAEMEE